jgi:hypothetical protein
LPDTWARIKCPQCGMVAQTRATVNPGSRVRCPRCQRSFEFAPRKSNDPSIADDPLEKLGIWVTPDLLPGLIPPGKAGKLVRCPDCGREISRLAPCCPQCGRPFRRAKVSKRANALLSGCVLISVTLLLCVVAFVLVFGGALLTNQASRDRGSASSSSDPRPGEEAQLKGLGLRNGVWLALDENSWDAMLDAQNEGAKEGPGAGSALFRLAQAGKVRIYPIGTRVRVLKSGFGSRLVEVLEGPDRGDRGWVQSELVSRP